MCHGSERDPVRYARVRAGEPYSHPKNVYLKESDVLGHVDEC
jgi:hypothetical protein